MAGWISGGDHPTVAYETVTRTACMHWSTSCCYNSYTIEIRNCSGFYVYMLKKPSDCDQRYCGVNGKFTLISSIASLLLFFNTIFIFLYFILS